MPLEVRRDALSAKDGAPVQGYGFEAAPRAASQAAAGADPQRSVRAFIQRLNARARQPVGGSERGEVIAVITVQTILGAHPQEPGAILQHCLDRQVLEPFLFAVELEVVALSPGGRRREAASSKSDQPDWTQT